MLTEKFQSNLVKLMEIANSSDDITNCHVIIVNNDNKDWKKSIRSIIYEEQTLSIKRHYSIVCEIFSNDKHDKLDFNGCITVHIRNILDDIDDFECMIITISSPCFFYNKEKGMLEKFKIVYVIAKN